MDNDQEFEPTGMANFFQRYHEARASKSPPTTPTASAPKPPSSPPTPSKPKTAQSTWTKVFMPLGRPATSANRYDLSPGQTSKPGHSVSELHAKGSGISLDAKNDDDM